MPRPNNLLRASVAEFFEAPVQTGSIFAQQAGAQTILNHAFKPAALVLPSLSGGVKNWATCAKK